MTEQRQCQECRTLVEEAKGRMLILDQDNSAKPIDNLIFTASSPFFTRLLGSDGTE
jgi:hypothetical protein